MKLIARSVQGGAGLPAKLCGECLDCTLQSLAGFAIDGSVLGATLFQEHLQLFAELSLHEAKRPSPELRAYCIFIAETISSAALR